MVQFLVFRVKNFFKYGRYPIVLLGEILHIVTYLVISLNLPSNLTTAKDGTMSIVYITPNIEVTVVCGFLLGFCDVCYYIQYLSIIGETYPDKSSEGFTLFNFVHSLSTAMVFFYSAYVQLQYQLIILVLFNVAGMLMFVIAELKLNHENKVLSNQYEGT